MSNKKCFFCGDRGYWEDTEALQTLFCPFCNRRKAEHQALAQVQSRSWVPSRWSLLEAKHYGPRFQVQPWLLVIHSGALSRHIAEFFHDPGVIKTPEGKEIKVSAHINWSQEEEGFVQSVPFTHVAWHCGGSRFNEKRKLNFCSIGIELPGPWNKDRDQQELDRVRESIIYITEILPSIRVAVRHSDIDPRKKDPGPGFTWECLEGLDLELPFKEST